MSQFFHILGSVDQQKGCCEVSDGKYEITLYTSCCNADKGIYYYTTYNNHQICAGLYVTAGTKITIWDKAKAAAGEPLEVVKGSDLSGKDNILFIRNSVNGRIEARYRKVGIELNEKLHKN